MSQYFLGVDGGQSNTTAMIGDEAGQVLGSGRAGPCNHVASAGGRERFLSALEGCVAAACKKAGLDRNRLRFAAACLGFSGGPQDKQALVEQVVQADKILVTTDAWIALAGATGGKPGIIVLAGTGCIAFGRNAAGRTARAGGWGYVFGDDGGAFDIVRQALRAWLRFEEGWGPATSLRRKFMEATGVATANELLHLFYTEDFPRDRVASYATLVDEAVLEGDEVARQVVSHAAQQLARIATAVREQLFNPGDPVLVAHAGGAFRNTLLRDLFRAAVEMDPDCKCSDPLHKPAKGALLEAYRAAGLSPQTTR